MNGVTPEVEVGGECVGARGMTMSAPWLILGKNEIHIEMKEISRLCKYETACLNKDS